MGGLYLREHVRLHLSRTPDPRVTISEYLQWFSKDFGRSKRDALRHWLRLMGSKQNVTDSLKIKVRKGRLGGTIDEAFGETRTSDSRALPRCCEGASSTI